MKFTHDTKHIKSELLWFLENFPMYFTMYKII